MFCTFVGSSPYIYFSVDKIIYNLEWSYEYPSEKAMAPHSSTLAWKIPWTEEPGRLLSMGSLRVRQDRATSLSLLLSFIGEGNGNPLQCSCLENPRDGETWWAAIYGVAQSRTQLKRPSSGSSSSMNILPSPFLMNILLFFIFLLYKNQPTKNLQSFYSK